jgi:hypothetical protein
MNIGASLALVFTIMSLPAYAQGTKPPTVQSLADQVAALTARVAKIESGKVTMADLAGFYLVHALGVELHGGPAQIGTETAFATMTLRANGTGTLGGWTDKRSDLGEGQPWSVTFQPPTDYFGEFTWSLVNGNTLSLFNGTFEATIAAGGRMFVWGDQAQVDEGSWSQLGIAIRVP